MIDRIVSYIAQGFPDSRVAEIVGCSASYVSQVKASENFAKDLEEEKEKLRKHHVESELEKKYESLETRTVKAVEENLPFAEFKDLSRMMEILIRRKQQVPSGIIVNNTTHNNVVVLQVPQAAIPEIRLNSKKEVIAVDGKSLAPMPSTQVRDLFSVLEEKTRKAKQYKALELKGEVVTSELPSDF